MRHNNLALAVLLCTVALFSHPQFVKADACSTVTKCVGEPTTLNWTSSNVTTCTPTYGSTCSFAPNPNETRSQSVSSAVSCDVTLSCTGNGTVTACSHLVIDTTKTWDPGSGTCIPGGGTPPGNPTNFRGTAQACDSGAIRLDWDSVSGANSYIVQEGASVLYNGAGLTTTVSGLAAGSIHSYTVFARNSNGTSSGSSISVTAPAACAAGAPVVTLNGISARGGRSQGPVSVAYGEDGTTAKIDWTSTNGATSCSLYSGGTLVASGLPPAHSAYPVPGVITSPISYYVTCTNGTVGTSNTVLFDVPPVPTPGSVTCNAAGTQATLNWTLPSGYSYAYIRLYKTPPSSIDYNSACNPVQTEPNGLCADNYNGTSRPTTVLPNTQYFWFLHTEHVSGNWSNAVSGGTFTCPSSATPPTVDNVTITPLVANNITPNASNQYNITVTGSDATGGANIDWELALINYQGTNAGAHRGYLAWSPTGIFGNPTVACGGGGVMEKGLLGAGYGEAYINLVSCSTSVSGNTRTTNFVVTFNPSFTTPTTQNDISGYLRDVATRNSGWVNFDINFGLAASVYSCTGSDPSNAALCSGDNSGLSADTAKSVVNSCTATKCEFTCNPGYTNNGGTCVGQPDLQPAVLNTVTPTTAVAGTATNFGMEIRNTGTGSTVTSFTNRLRKANDAAGTGSVNVNINTAGPLAANGGQTTGFTIPYTPVAADIGTKYFSICADENLSGVGSIVESNASGTGESNNCGAWTAVTIPPPNLVSQNLTSNPAAPFVASQSPTFTATVRNTGSATANKFVDEFRYCYGAGCTPTTLIGTAIQHTGLGAAPSTDTSAASLFVSDTVTPLRVQHCVDTTNAIADDPSDDCEIVDFDVTPNNAGVKLSVGPSCVIADDASTCKSKAWWSSNSVPQAYLWDENVRQRLTTGTEAATTLNNPPGFDVWVAYPQTTFDIIDGATGIVKSGPKVITASCGPNSKFDGASNTCVHNVTIDSFTPEAGATPGSPIANGGSTSLDVIGVKGGGLIRCSIDKNVGAVNIDDDSHNSSPNPSTGTLSSSTVFTLTCSNGVGPNAEAQTTVYVGTGPGSGGTISCSRDGGPSAPVNTTVTFTASGASTPYIFRDDITNQVLQSGGDTYVHTYSNPGSYAVRVSGNGVTGTASCGTIVIGGGTCATQPAASIAATPARIHQGDNTTVTWTASGITNQCEITGTNGYDSGPIPATHPSCNVPGSGSGFAPTPALQTQTIFTIACDCDGSGNNCAVKKSVTVNVLPIFQPF